jgi:uncharacterized sulfatase
VRRRRFLLTALAFGGGCLSLALHAGQPAPAGSTRLPSIVLIVADDLGYGDLGVYGQQQVATPNIDRLAAEGMRFTQFYAGSTVCAPSRAVLMTGRHTGHVSVRGNASGGRLGIQALRRDDRTIAHVLRDAGYATAIFGKWGLGEIGSDGHPMRMGWDESFGYLNQTHAHNYYPSFLVRGNDRVALRNVPEEEGDRGQGFARERVEYSHDVIVERALEWMTQHRDRPFFLFLPVTVPHANNERTRARGDGMEVPDYGPYAGKPWKDPDKGFAGMVHRLDRDVGRVRARLADLGLDRSTLVLFTSDNGPQKEGGNDPDFFDSNGPLRGLKRALYEGGIRVPLVAWWPGRIRPGVVTDHVGYFGDVFATLSEVARQAAAPGLDSISVLPTLLGHAARQRQHEYLYWEFYEQGGRQAVRFGNWKAVRQPGFDGPVELYDLASDLAESRDVAADHPDLVTRAVEMMKRAHVPDPAWKVEGTPAK